VYPKISLQNLIGDGRFPWGNGEFNLNQSRKKEQIFIIKSKRGVVRICGRGHTGTKSSTNYVFWTGMGPSAILIQISGGWGWQANSRKSGLP
jgi:metal-dependent hydrolase (beta-lactamase superfamily II)